MRWEGEIRIGGQMGEREIPTSVLRQLGVWPVRYGHDSTPRVALPQGGGCEGTLSLRQTEKRRSWTSCHALRNSVMSSWLKITWAGITVSLSPGASTCNTLGCSLIPQPLKGPAHSNPCPKLQPQKGDMAWMHVWEGSCNFTETGLTMVSSKMTN